VGGGPVGQQGTKLKKVGSTTLRRSGGVAQRVDAGEGAHGWGPARWAGCFGRPNVNSLIFYLFKQF
jgi:hypothetical protein